MSERTLTRRRMLGSLLGAPALYAQGVASRGARATPRSKPSGLPFASKLTDVAASAGLTKAAVCGGVARKDYLIEVIGCGVAFFDYDNDGWMDLILLSGSRLDGSASAATNRLYRNNRDGTFADVTTEAGLVRNGWATGITIADYNNDGYEDIFITYWGHNVLYRNNGDGTFSDVTKQAGLAGSGREWGSGCTWVDYDRDGRLDLFVANYAGYDLATVPKAGASPDCNWKGVAVNCGPRGLPTTRPYLYHNNGDGTFTDVSERSGVAAATGSYGLTAVTADLDDDGWPDIYMAGDSTPSFFFHNRKDGTFREEAILRGVALSEDGMEQAGMGVALGDINLEGNTDILKTNFADDTPDLYVNDGKGRFSDATLRSGLGVETRYVCWGTGIVDLDNNGLPDLFIVTGSIYPELEPKFPQYPYRTPRLVFRNLGFGRFEELIDEAGSGVGAAHSSRGCAFGDFDNDGDLDVLIWNMNEPPSLLRNDVTGGGHWLKVRLIGVKTNRSAIGSRVTVRYGDRVQAQDVTAQASFLSVNDKRLHFGLGNSTTAEVTVRWTNGSTERIGKVAVDCLLTIREGQGVVQADRLKR
ncbi:MAG TPA: CRTAC1 family protein [Bryobacteraceae bacterium]|nr:CRTAC1 family protein [Bryobacteraceae bacterium]